MKSPDVAIPASLTHAVALPSTKGLLEHLPKSLNLVPMVVQWLWLSLKYGSVTLPSCADPAITSGGLVGEGKMEYFNTMGPFALAHTARSVPRVADDTLTIPEGFTYPFIVKPDVGWCGFGIRRIDDPAQLRAYLQLFPRGETIIFQEYLPQEHEAGIFYARKPGESKGRIIGILQRSYPRVTGDGHSNVAALMAANPRLARLGRDGLHMCTHDPRYVPAAGETVRLATIGSTRVGGLYQDLSAHITPALEVLMDNLAHDMTDFHMGRFDTRFDTIENLRAGRGIKIMEVNGAGSEAVHAWDPRYTLREAYGIVFAKQRLLFSIGNAMRARGHKPVGIWELAKLYIRQQHLIRRYPPSN
jgi:hypothetical protein